MESLKTRKPGSRPCLRFHGGKHRLAGWILSHFPPHRTYVEPYSGAASVLLQKERCYAEVINDLDGDLVNFFRVLRDPASAKELKIALELTPYARSEFRAAYAPSVDAVERARRLVVRSFMGFGSGGSNTEYHTGFRSSCTRSGTTLAHDWMHYPEHVMAFCERLRGIVIESRPASQVIANYDATTTLFYVDPPYVHSTRYHGRQYKKPAYKHEMTDEDHRALGKLLREASGMVVLSGYASDLYDREIFRDWHRVECVAHADDARPRVEALWLNAAAQVALRRVSDQLDLFVDSESHYTYRRVSNSDGESEGAAKP